MNLMNHYIQKLKNAYYRHDTEAFNQNVEELIWGEWDEIPAIILSFDFVKINQNFFYKYLFQSFFGDLSHFFFQLPYVIFPLPLRTSYMEDYHFFSKFFEALAKRKSTLFVFSSKLFFNLIKSSARIYSNLETLLSDKLNLTREELWTLLTEIFQFLQDLFQRIDQTFKSNFSKSIENSNSTTHPLNRIIQRHINPELWNRLLSRDERNYANAPKLNDLFINPSLISIDGLKNEVFHGILLWEMITHGYFNTYLTRLHLSIPPAVFTNPFKIIVALCEETPGIYAHFIGYFASQLVKYSVMGF